MFKGDLDRHARTQKLMQSGALSTGEDLYRAAFIFQHGSKPSDYLLAHSLAIAAAARGKTHATWIAAATLDRYLQAIGQKQIFGTQFDLPRGQPVTQEPYDRDLIPDALRKVLSVPVQAEQEQRRQQMQARHLPGTPAGAKP